MYFALLQVGAVLLHVPAATLLVQLTHKLQGPPAVLLDSRVEELHIVTDQPDVGRVQLLLAQGASAVVQLAQVLLREELWEEVHQQAGGEVANGQAALLDAAQLLPARCCAAAPCSEGSLHRASPSQTGGSLVCQSQWAPARSSWSAGQTARSQSRPPPSPRRCCPAPRGVVVVTESYN